MQTRRRGYGARSSRALTPCLPLVRSGFKASLPASRANRQAHKPRPRLRFHGRIIDNNAARTVYVHYGTPHTKRCRDRMAGYAPTPKKALDIDTPDRCVYSVAMIRDENCHQLPSPASCTAPFLETLPIVYAAGPRWWVSSPHGGAPTQRPTNGFFVLTCTRVCPSCFQADARLIMCSFRYIAPRSSSFLR